MPSLSLFPPVSLYHVPAGGDIDEAALVAQMMAMHTTPGGEPAETMAQSADEATGASVPQESGDASASAAAAEQA